MKKNVFSVFGVMGLSMVLLLTGCGSPGSDSRPELQSVRDKASYTIGLSIGADLMAQGMDIDAKLLARGIKDAINQAEPLLTDEQMNEAIAAFQEEMLNKHEALMSELGAENLAAGLEFLAENAKRDDVVELASGLQYRVEVVGDGASPGENDVVSVHYEGRLLDGTVFDSSFKRGQPAVFPVNAVIPGWTEALQLMRVGDKWDIFLPAALAYGERGVPPVIGPNSALVFMIELLEVNPSN
ncbi:MAG: FKBP-type peptidyl-prolyl cis-trans isomerase [Desulfobulbaceae bacterium]|nr:MAG: FKBP-type peptidyl-prolyl cis-trans isomerase [Desulfobulbaceae bacterium]